MKLTRYDPAEARRIIAERLRYIVEHYPKISKYVLISLVFVLIAIFVLFGLVIYLLLKDPVLPRIDTNTTFPIAKSSEKKEKVKAAFVPQDNLYSTMDEQTLETIAERYAVPNSGERYDESGLPHGRKWLYFSEFKGEHLKDLSEEQRKAFKAWKEKHMKEFVAFVRPIATEMEKRHGVPADIIVAQAILESAYGTSRLAVTATNLFGHKWRKTNRGEKGIVGFVNAHDDSIHDVFVQYETLWYAFNKHAIILTAYQARSPLVGFPECLCSHKLKYATACKKGTYVPNITRTINSLKKQI
jgi:flagellum-specific peptidoglycan hydrolase FlgJ